MNKPINLTLDGKKVQAEEGKNLIDVAKDNGIEIPTLCYYLNSASVFYYKAKLHAIIGNAQKNLLTINNAMFALLFPALHQY